MRFRLVGMICGALLLTNLLLAIGAEEGKELQFEVLGREVPSIMIDSGRDEPQSGLGNAGFGSVVLLAIKTEEYWKRFVAGGVSTYDLTRKALNEERPDFSKDMVIALGTFHVGGITGQGRSREVVITRIVETQDRLSVYVQEGAERVGGGCMGQHFFYVVRLPRSDKTVELIPER